MASQGSDKAPSSEDLAEQMAQLRADLEKISGMVRTMAEQRATDLGNRAVANGRAVLDDVNDFAGGIERRANAELDERPLQTLAIAAGLGALIGYLVRRD